MKKAIKAIFIVAVAAVAGYNVYTNLESNTMSDLVLANIEALAQTESGREDCMSADDICSEIVIYPDGDYGEDILLGHTKKPGWL